MTPLSKEMVFFIFLLEQYAAHKGTSADLILKQWDRLQLTDHICRMYEQYHSEVLENAFEDIDRLIGEKTNSSVCRNK